MSAEFTQITKELQSHTGELLGQAALLWEHIVELKYGASMNPADVTPDMAPAILMGSTDWDRTEEGECLRAQAVRMSVEGYSAEKRTVNKVAFTISPVASGYPLLDGTVGETSRVPVLTKLEDEDDPLEAHYELSFSDVATALPEELEGDAYSRLVEARRGYVTPVYDGQVAIHSGDRSSTYWPDDSLQLSVDTAAPQAECQTAPNVLPEAVVTLASLKDQVDTIRRIQATQELLEIELKNY